MRNIEHELAHNIIRITSLHQLTPCSHPGDDDTSVPSTSNVIRVEKESTNDVYVESTTINMIRLPNIMVFVVFGDGLSVRLLLQRYLPLSIYDLSREEKYAGL